MPHLHTLVIGFTFFFAMLFLVGASPSHTINAGGGGRGIRGGVSSQEVTLRSTGQTVGGLGDVTSENSMRREIEELKENIGELIDISKMISSAQ